MDYDDERHAAAIGALPALWRTLFRLHNFYGVEIALMAEALATDEASILVCLDEARTMIHRQFPIWERQHPTPPGAGSPATRLEQRLRLDYRAAQEAIFAKAGYAGTILWAVSSTSIEADEEAAARFVLKFLRHPLRMAHTRSTKPNIATIDLWRHAPSWRRIERRSLLEIASEIRCSGWQAFDIWLANRIAPDLDYPSRLVLPRYQRRPLPEELTPPHEGYRMLYWPDDAARQLRFDRLPIPTQHVAALILLYGRSYYEIARRLGISRHDAQRRFRKALIVIAFSPRRPVAETLSIDIRFGWRLLKRKARRVWSAHRNQPRAPS